MRPRCVIARCAADVDVAEAARKLGIRVIGDLELASWFLKGETIGITGANGKTTTTAMTGPLLQSSGHPRASGWQHRDATVRHGRDLTRRTMECPRTLQFPVGDNGNISRPHRRCVERHAGSLDRHHTFEKYAEAKGRLFVNQTPADHAVLNADDEVTRGYEHRGAGAVHWFSAKRPVDQGRVCGERADSLEWTAVDANRRSAFARRTQHRKHHGRGSDGELSRCARTHRSGPL